MDEYVHFDELRLIVRVPRDLDEAACEAIRRILDSRQFRARLRRAVRQVFRHFRDLDAVRVRITG